MDAGTGSEEEGVTRTQSSTGPPQGWAGAPFWSSLTNTMYPLVCGSDALSSQLCPQHDERTLSWFPEPWHPIIKTQCGPCLGTAAHPSPPEQSLCRKHPALQNESMKAQLACFQALGLSFSICQMEQMQPMPATAPTLLKAEQSWAADLLWSSSTACPPGQALLGPQALLRLPGQGHHFPRGWGKVRSTQVGKAGGSSRASRGRGWDTRAFTVSSLVLQQPCMSPETRPGHSFPRAVSRFPGTGDGLSGR